MKNIIIFGILAFMVGCVKMVPNNQLNSDSVPNNTPMPTTQSEIDQIVSTYNNYELAIGNDQISNGLVCRLYTVPSNTSGIVGAPLTTVGSWEYVGDFNQSNVSASEGLNILPSQIRPYYIQFFIVKCTGYLIVTQNQFYEFSLSSDDGSLLYVDGLLINNDGQHGIETVNKTKFLEYGVHSFELDYFEGPGGNEALILNMNETLLSSANLYH